jgi:FMN reductase
MHLVVLLGSVTPPGRLASALRGALKRAAAQGHQTTLLDLSQLRLGFADGRPIEDLDDDTGSMVLALTAADAVILATPVYRATLSGALKNALDLTPIDALRGKPIGIVAMGATQHHFLGAESHLRDILAWFGAVTAPTGVYLASSDFKDGQLTDEAAGLLDALVATLAALERVTSVADLGPVPLAARR